VISGAAGVAAPSDGWAYNPVNGAFICNYSGASPVDGTNYDKF
jgi:hypothetical protein